MMEAPPRVLARARELDRLPAYVYDLPGLREHAAAVQAALAPVEIFYAAKANPDPAILRALAPHVHGVEVSSGGELTHVRGTLPDALLAFGGPGKTDEELALIRPSDVRRVHVESPAELARLARLAEPDRPIDILLRANLPFEVPGAALAMSGPFGMDLDGLRTCARLLAGMPSLRLRGVHTHLASGLEAGAMLDLAAQIVGWALPWLARAAPGLARPEINLGGGMAVDYAAPGSLFDWTRYGAGLRDLGDLGPARLRIEPGRALTAYHGWYVTDVLDIKMTRGRTYVVLRGGTHHLRTPVTKGHDQPFTVIRSGRSGSSGWSGTPVAERAATLVGQLCTPKDVFARQARIGELSPGDLVAFGMAGAYAWNISHHDFLMHPKPAFHHLD